MAIVEMELRSQFNYDTMKASDEAGLTCPEPSLTQQHQKDESDINTIVRRFGLTGELPTNVRQPQYGDFTGIGTYQEALHAVQAANEAFMKYPAEVRNRFNNDPAQFVDFCLDPANKAEAIKLGLVEKPLTPPVQGATATEPAVPAAQPTT